jgi:hypothetical protein
MTSVYETAAASSPYRQQAVEIAAGNGGHLGLSREQAIEKLRSQGIEPGADGKMSSAPRDRRPEEFSLPADSPISRDELVALKLDPTLAHVIARDLAVAKIDLEAVKAEVGEDRYKALLGDVTAMLTAANVTSIKPSSLSAHSLVALAAFARHRAPKG